LRPTTAATEEDTGRIGAVTVWEAQEAMDAGGVLDADL
jgi:hypothetical protein